MLFIWIFEYRVALLDKDGMFKSCIEKPLRNACARFAALKDKDYLSEKEVSLLFYPITLRNDRYSVDDLVMDLNEAAKYDSKTCYEVLER